MKVATPPDIKVSVAEVCEVRGAGLEAHELLSLAASAAESLPPCPKGTVFDAENVYISSRGTVEIKTIPQSKADPSFIPPEWSKGDDDPGAAAVYCMGAVLRAAGAEHAADVDLFSLVNILTVAMVGTRPTAHRMGLMAKNQLRGRDPTVCLITIYEEIMGDEETNQLEDGDYSMDEDDDDIGALIGNPPQRIANGSLPTVTVTSVSNVSQQSVKKAVDFFDEDEELESRAHSASTSSGHSTQKDHSPFFADHDIDSKKDAVSSSSAAPVPPASERAMESLGSPTSGESTRLEETYIEEHSIDLDVSFDKQLETSLVEETKAIPNYRKSSGAKQFKEFQKEDTSFDADLDFDDGKVQSRRSLKDEEASSLAQIREKARKSLPHQNSIRTPTEPDRDFPKSKPHINHQPLVHKFSSSDEDIVQARIDDDDDMIAPVPPRRRSYFDDITEVREESSKTEMETSWKRPNQNQPKEAATPSPLMSTPGTSQAEDSAPSARSKESSISMLDEEDVASEREDQDRTHVDAVVITKTPTEPIKASETADEESTIDAAFEDAIRQRRRSDVPLVADGILSPPTPPPPSAPAVLRHDSPRLERHNSLLPNRISGRQSNRSMRGKRKTRAVPEFFDHSRHPSIRLKAPSAKKKKVTLLRVEQADVQVELLNGQRVEVSCRSDAVARDIFSLVVQHMNINEHVFFGLSFLKDGEHFFLEDHQRLEKFAPPGWKSAHKNGLRTQFILYLRFRFYPQVLDFIKTDVTMHELYLQVRHDVIEERIQPRRDAAYELAALALQAEFGNRPPPVIHDYFDNQHYLSQRYCASDDPKRLQAVLSEMHGHYAGTKSVDAEHKFIQICQRHRDFGAHLHRVFRNKPTGNHGAAPFDPDTGAALWVAIMPRGIGVYEEQGSVRELLAEHLWQDTQTLQFDKKKFVIIAVEGSQQTESIFYTDHHTKSAYFVKFSASQHRFMMRMRQWKSTLRHESTIQAMPDVCVEGRDPPRPPQRDVDEPMEEAPSPLEAAESMFAKMPTVTHPEPETTPQPAPQRPQSLEVSNRDRTASVEKNNNQDSMNNSMVERFETLHPIESPDGEFPGMRFEVTLVKDPSSGLGLTLVDGNLNGVKGVYVKSVAENGAGMRAGLSVGDRLVGVDGMSLEGGDRHRAVELVRQSGDSVRMEIARLDGVVRHEKMHSGDAAKKLSSGGTPGVLTVTPQKGVSRTPPAPRRAVNRRQRAVSDFGAIGDTLPALDSDNVINIKAISGLHLDESDEEQGEYRLPTSSMYSFDNHYDDDSPSSPKTSDSVSPTELARHAVPALEGRRKYRYARKSNLEWTDELEEVGEENETDEDIINVELERNSVGSLGVQIASVSGRVCIKQLTSEPAASHPDIHVGDTLVYVNGEPVANKSHQEVVSMLRSGGNVVTLGLRREPEKKGNIITAVLEKKPEGSLGLSLAKRTGSEGIFIRMIAANSAAAVEGSLRVGDRLLSLDGESVTDLTPTAILERLRAIQGAVHVTVSRDPQ